ncbi:hypothetical protein [Sulfurimonas sp. HSL3-7]|uniref:subtilisin-like serine protease QhpE n=1 Tax=Sulfonitrofixus jiaomeiensis TaxID=3131938 RepID=UPI0031F965B1
MAEREVFVALIDSGCSFETYYKAAIEVEAKRPKVVEPKAVRFKHGDTVGAIITEAANVALYDIQVFDERLATTPLHVLGALEYMMEKKVDLIHLSLGLKTNYREIESLCEALIEKGVAIVASFPRAGAEFVYPASYDGVISVTSDGMCAEGEVSLLNEKRLIFGANPLSNVEGVGGSSVAVAKFTRLFCRYLGEGYSRDESLELIKKGAIR